MADPIPPHPTPADDDGDDKACPVCGETIKAAAIKCRFCNTDLEVFAAEKDAQVEHMLYQGHPAVVYHFLQWIVILMTAGIALIFYWLKGLATTFEITTQRVRIERGLFSTEKDTLELFRIDHFEIYKPFGMRILGYCELHLSSSDSGFKTVVLYGIPDLEAVADKLRECSLHERSRRKVTTFVQA